MANAFDRHKKKKNDSDVLAAVYYSKSVFTYCARSGVPQGSVLAPLVFSPSADDNEIFLEPFQPH
jgi:hypothetical protein